MTRNRCVFLSLKQLHWLPVIDPIKFKLATVTYRTLSTQQLTLVNLHFSDISRTTRSCFQTTFPLYLFGGFMLEC